jgi:hypothetical protein
VVIRRCTSLSHRMQNGDGGMDLDNELYERYRKRYFGNDSDESNLRVIRTAISSNKKPPAAKSTTDLALPPTLKAMSRPSVRRIIALSTTKDGISSLANLLLAVVVIVQHAVRTVGAITDSLETGNGIRRVVACSLAFLHRDTPC